MTHSKSAYRVEAGDASGSNRPPPASFSLRNQLLTVTAVFATLFILGLNEAYAQSGWEPGDVVTWADSRDVRCGDVTEREVVFATFGGVWRLDRQTAQALEPWSAGVGREVAQTLAGGRLILWDENTSSMLLATSSGVYLYSWGFQLWQKVVNVRSGQVTRLGERDGTLFIDQSGKFSELDPLTARLLSPAISSVEAVRWVGSFSPGEFPSYRCDDFAYRFERADGRIVDQDFVEYKPVYQFQDEEFHRRYICYPGLGIGVADERSMTIRVIVTGPTGPDVRAIAIGSDGELWVGGDNPGDQNGISHFDRHTLDWTRYGRRQLTGLESNQVFDLVFAQGMLYAATKLGLSSYDQRLARWKTYGLLEGAPSPPLRTLAVANGWLILGGDNGAMRTPLPAGPFFKLDNPHLKDIRAAQTAVDVDTVWLAGVDGLFTGTPTGKWRYLGGDRTIGDQPARAVAVGADIVAVGGEAGVRLYNRYTGDWTAIPAGVYLNGGKTLSLAVADSLVGSVPSEGFIDTIVKGGRSVASESNRGYLHLEFKEL